MIGSVSGLRLRLRHDNDSVEQRHDGAGRADLFGAGYDVSKSFYRAAIAGPEALSANTLPSGIGAIYSDAVRGSSNVGLASGVTVGLGAQLQFTVVFSNGLADANSVLLLNNGGVARLVSGAGTGRAVYQFEVTSLTNSTDTLVIDGFRPGDGSLRPANVSANFGIDTAISSPSDPLYVSAWYVNSDWGTHADKVWADYTGRGVTVAVCDSGIDYAHPDLLPNLNIALGYNPYSDTHNGTTDTRNGNADAEVHPGENDHGTVVAGLIAGARNGIGSVGVAYDATLYAIFTDFETEYPDYSMFFARMFADAGLHADVMNNSWGYGSSFNPEADFGGAGAAAGAALAAAATDGRDGLGLIVVQSAGNSGEFHADTNASNFSNSRFTVVVGASEPNGTVASFSTPGASILVSAPGDAQVSTDRLGGEGYNTSPTNGDYTNTPSSYFSGTSGSAPVVSGVVALMLEANPHLGARDVQQILAYSAQPGNGTPGTFLNGAGNWNNGGLRFSDYSGAGLVDARAAVRLAETWEGQRTWSNVAEQSATIAPAESMTLAGSGSVSMTKVIHIASDQTIDRVDLKIDVDTSHAEFLTVSLTSPDGTTSVLIDRVNANPGTNNYSAFNTFFDDGLHFTLDSAQFMGEHAAGDWTVTVTSQSFGTSESYYELGSGRVVTKPIGFPVTTTLQSAELTVYGDAVDANTTYFYTDAYANAFNGAKLVDADGGYDTINAAAVSGVVTIDLTGAGVSSLDKRALEIADDHVWRVFGGDAGDTITGSNTTPTLLLGMRGNDTLIAGSATTILVGGTGNDRLIAGDESAFTIGRFAGSFTTVFAQFSAGDLVIAVGTDGVDRCTGLDWVAMDDAVFRLVGQTTVQVADGACDVSIDPGIGLCLAQNALSFLSYSADLAADADQLASLVITDATALTLDVAQLLGASPLLDLIDNVLFSLDDTAAAISAAIGDLSPLGDELTYVSVSDGAAVQLTQAEFEGATALLSRLNGDYLLSVAQDAGGTHVYSRTGLVEKVTVEDADGSIISLTKTDPDASYAQVVKTYAGGQLVSAEYDGVTGHAFTHAVRSYADGHLVSETRDGYPAFTFDSRTIDYDAAGTKRSVHTTGYFEGRFSELTVTYDADGHLQSRDGVLAGTGNGHDRFATFYLPDGTRYATLYDYEGQQSFLEGSKLDDTLSLALAENVLGKRGADRFVVSLDEPNGYVADFSRGQGDRIDLSQVFASADDAHFTGAATFGGQGGEIIFASASQTTTVSIDLDGDKMADVSFDVHAAHMVATDFVF